MSTGIEGIVTDKQNQPLPFASVSLKNTTKGAATDLNGRFKIENPEPGTYILQAQSLGYSGSEHIVQADPGKVVKLTVVLYESTVDLQEVQVEGKSKARQVRETPFAITSVDVGQLHNSNQHLLPGCRHLMVVAQQK